MYFNSSCFGYTVQLPILPAFHFSASRYFSSAVQCIQAFRPFKQNSFRFLHFQPCFAIPFSCQHSHVFPQEMPFLVYYSYFFRTFFGTYLLLHTFSYRNHSSIKTCVSIGNGVLLLLLFIPFILFKILSFFQLFFNIKVNERKLQILFNLLHFELQLLPHTFSYRLHLSFNRVTRLSAIPLVFSFLISCTVFTQSQFMFYVILCIGGMFRPRVRDVTHDITHSSFRASSFIQNLGKHYHLTPTASTLQAQFIHKIVDKFVLFQTMLLPLK